MTGIDPKTQVRDVERFLDEIERGDVDAAIKAADSLVHPEMEFTSAIGSEVDGRTYIGVEGLREWFQEFSDVFEEVRYEDRDIRVFGDDVVVGLFTFHMRGRGSRVEVTRKIGTVWEFKDDRMVRAISYPSQDLALKAAESAHA
jgi:ketosteroid isomerase-like protein